MFGFAISILSLKWLHKPTKLDLPYHNHRAEIVGTLFSILILWILNIWLLYEATMRIFTPEPVKGTMMLFVSILGLFFKIIQMKVLDLKHGAGTTGAIP